MVKYMKVSFDKETDTINCNCYQFERIGLPCVHMYSVIKCVDPNWSGFTHHEVSVRWWSVYMAKGYPSGSSCPISQALASLASRDIVAPVIVSFKKVLDGCNLPIRTPRESKVAWERVTNYSADELQKVFCKQFERDDEGEWNCIGHSQSTFHPQSEEGDYPQNQDEDESCNLFDKFEEVADCDESKFALLERKLHRFLSIYKKLGTAEQSFAERRVENLLAQTRADYARNQSKLTGTVSSIVEEHAMRARTFNTHHPYYN